TSPCQKQKRKQILRKKRAARVSSPFDSSVCVPSFSASPCLKQTVTITSRQSNVRVTIQGRTAALAPAISWQISPCRGLSDIRRFRLSGFASPREADDETDHENPRGDCRNQALRGCTKKHDAAAPFLSLTHIEIE